MIRYCVFPIIPFTIQGNGRYTTFPEIISKCKNLNFLSI